MSLHLIKLAVGVDTLDHLRSVLHGRVEQDPDIGPMVRIRTRMTPKRMDELLQGGSLYWVIRGRVAGRSPILDIRTVETDGKRFCHICVAPVPVAVETCPKRAFQGWRYLRPEDAPPDAKEVAGADSLPDDMRRELEGLGLL